MQIPVRAISNGCTFVLCYIENWECIWVKVSVSMVTSRYVFVFITTKSCFFFFLFLHVLSPTIQKALSLCTACNSAEKKKKKYNSTCLSCHVYHILVILSLSTWSLSPARSLAHVSSQLIRIENDGALFAVTALLYAYFNPLSIDRSHAFFLFDLKSNRFGESFTHARQSINDVFSTTVIWFIFKNTELCWK